MSKPAFTRWWKKAGDIVLFASVSLSSESFNAQGRHPASKTATYSSNLMPCARGSERPQLIVLVWRRI